MAKVASAARASADSKVPLLRLPSLEVAWYLNRGLAMPAYWPTLMTSETVVMPVQTLSSPSWVMERMCLARSA